MTLDAFKDSRPARILFWAAMLLVLVMASLPHPPHLPYEPSDKIEHMAAFATLAVLGALAYGRISAPRMVAALSLFGALIEVVQAIPAIHRDSDPLDWVADTVACGLVLIAIAWRRRRSTHGS